MGRVVLGEGVRAHPDKVKAITELKPSSCEAELRQVLGMVNYMGRYIPDLSAVLQRMNELLKKEVVWIWGTTKSIRQNQTTSFNYPYSDIL